MVAFRPTLSGHGAIGGGRKLRQDTEDVPRCPQAAPLAALHQQLQEKNPAAPT